MIEKIVSGLRQGETWKADTGQEMHPFCLFAPHVEKVNVEARINYLVGTAFTPKGMRCPFSLLWCDLNKMQWISGPRGRKPCCFAV